MIIRFYWLLLTIYLLTIRVLDHSDTFYSLPIDWKFVWPRADHSHSLHHVTWEAGPMSVTSRWRTVSPIQLSTIHHLTHRLTLHLEVSLHSLDKFPLVLGEPPPGGRVSFYRGMPLPGRPRWASGVHSHRLSWWWPPLLEGLGWEAWATSGNCILWACSEGGDHFVHPRTPISYTFPGPFSLIFTFPRRQAWKTDLTVQAWWSSLQITDTMPFTIVVPHLFSIQGHSGDSTPFITFYGLIVVGRYSSTFTWGTFMEQTPGPDLPISHSWKEYVEPWKAPGISLRWAEFAVEFHIHPYVLEEPVSPFGHSALIMQPFYHFILEYVVGRRNFPLILPDLFTTFATPPHHLHLPHTPASYLHTTYHHHTSTSFPTISATLGHFLWNRAWVPICLRWVPKVWVLRLRFFLFGDACDLQISRSGWGVSPTGAILWVFWCRPTWYLRSYSLIHHRQADSTAFDPSSIYLTVIFDTWMSHSCSKASDRACFCHSFVTIDLIPVLGAFHDLMELVPFTRYIQFPFEAVPCSHDLFWVTPYWGYSA